MSGRTIVTNTRHLTSAEKELLWLAGYDAFGGRPFSVPSQQRQDRESLFSMGYIEPVNSMTAEGAWALTPSGHRRVRHLMPTYQVPEHALETHPEDRAEATPAREPPTMPVERRVVYTIKPWQARQAVAEWARAHIPELAGVEELKTETLDDGTVTVEFNSSVRVPQDSH